ncbi:hypothetical protein AHAS_Ahas13G0497900 [Arachis hypogaea]
MMLLSPKISLSVVIALSIITILSYADNNTGLLEVEIEALKAFKNSITLDPNGTLADWIEIHPHCNWSGIQCDPSSSHVISISLTSQQLHGEISPFLGNISSLQVLDLSSNSFTGHIPYQLSRCTQLTVLGLFENSLSGPIPPELGNLKRLQYLDLGSNFLNGTLPESIFNITSLLGIAFNNNNLTGTIPSHIGKLLNLIQMIGYGNSLVGSIPPSIGNLEALKALDFSQNQLSGVIPKEIGNLTNLQSLLLFQNSLSGKIPSELAKCKNLLNLELYENHLSGSIPPELGNLVHLETLRIFSNNLNSTIPPSIFQLKSLTHLGLSDNNLEGTISPEIGSLSSLTYLTLHLNKFTGRIPSSITSLKNLTYLSMSQNLLSGSIPPEIGNLSQLITLTLAENKLSGSIPPELSKLFLLQGLSLHDNELEGVIPERISGCRNLFNLDFSGNKISGPIPAEAFSHMDLLENLNLSRNHLDGKIPEVLAQLEHLISIDLSQNNLKGTIPQGFANLSKLMHLNLSFNQLEGPVPMTGIFAHINASDMKGNQDLCGAKFLRPCKEDKIFKTEASTLSQLRHRNLVKVLGYAWESGKLKALVLEYMENGNLDTIIHDKSVDQSRWTLSERIRVLISIASGLDYLHSGYDFPIVHCDLKPSNILLDRDWEAHVSDFGTARILGLHLQDGNTLSSSAALQGTIGYLAPEIAYIRKVTPKVDVFGFGIIVMEFLTKRRPTGLSEEDDGLPVSLPEAVEKAVANGMKELINIVDPMLAMDDTKGHVDALVGLFKLSLCCTLSNPEDRPNMNEVLSTLMKLQTAR